MQGAKAFQTFQFSEIALRLLLATQSLLAVHQPVHSNSKYDLISSSNQTTSSHPQQQHFDQLWSTTNMQPTAPIMANHFRWWRRTRTRPGPTHPKTQRAPSGNWNKLCPRHCWPLKTKVRAYIYTSAPTQHCRSLANAFMAHNLTCLHIVCVCFQ